MSQHESTKVHPKFGVRIFFIENERNEIGVSTASQPAASQPAGWQLAGWQSTGWLAAGWLAGSWLAGQISIISDVFTGPALTFTGFIKEIQRFR